MGNMIILKFKEKYKLYNSLEDKNEFYSFIANT